MNFVRLPLENAKNARDLGGYPTCDGKVTKFKVFVRSNRLTNLTTKDNEFLKDYGITDIIDLRGNTNIQATFVSDDNINKDYFNFHYIPLSNIELEEYSKKYEEQDFNYGIGYSYLLKNEIRIKEIFNVLIKAKGAVLFHCTAGKDRTGVVASLLLGLCNVNDEDIIANYQVTEIYVRDDEAVKKYSGNLIKSNAEYIETFIKILKEQYGSFKEYFLSIGISEEEIEKLQRKFCEDI